MRAVLEHPFRAATLSLLACALAALLLHGDGVEGLQALARYTGRAGFLWFALVFSISPWARLAPGDLARAALRARRGLGLAFGYHHFVHLAALLVYLRASGHELNAGRAAGGMVGYAVLALMMATSSDAAVRRLGPANWRRLHRAGLWYLWIVFLLTYLPRLLGKVPDAGGGPVEFTLAVALLAAILGLRVAAWRFARRLAVEKLAAAGKH